MRPWVKYTGLALLAATAFCTAKAAYDTLSDPVVRTAAVTLPGLPAEAGPLRLLVMSDLHVAGPDMPPERLAKIVQQVNVQRPDLVLLTGDLISDRRLASHHYTLAEAVAPLSGLRAKWGTVAVLGNHDHWRDAQIARKELQKTGAQVLANTAVRIGPLTIGGLDDDFTSHADPIATVAEMRKLGGPYVMISHSPDPFPDLPADMTLMMAGHTHCGQISVPFIGPVAYMSRHGDRYACGRIDEKGRTLIVSAGLGTSVLPFRFGVKPDVWAVTVSAPQPITQSGAGTE